MREVDVASLMTADVVAASPATPFKELVALLVGGGFGAAPVLLDGRPVGVVSRGDLLAKEEYRGRAELSPFAGPEARRRWRRAHGTTAADVMTTPVITVRPHDPARLAAAVLAEEDVHRVFVVDDSGRLVGVLSRGDLLRPFLRADAALRDVVEAELARRGLADVVVEVDGGVVVLAGLLEHRSDAEAAVRLVDSVPGVVGVLDGIAHRDVDAVADWRPDETLVGQGEVVKADKFRWLDDAPAPFPGARTGVPECGEAELPDGGPARWQGGAVRWRGGAAR
ncbi:MULTISPECIES: CBS domain-containing protein [Actinosynnema]|uniref:CBS domain-containing protein n=1 Tax=Actinosynnema TaxID=40566 RepID=UPI0020A53758|nr:CBS domain-containing protein [Actinosynnema pretiosum]MCP2092612.1 BON domain-containing protein [Actinosynnema pretiosum]